MPNATARANSPALPKDDEHETYIRLQAASRAYARWLRAVAQLEAPESGDEEIVNASFTEERAALRALFLAPAACPESVWAKFAAFEHDLVRERIAGEPKDSILLFGLGAIKADLMNLRIKGEV